MREEQIGTELKKNFMERSKSKVFNKAYNKVISDSRRLRKLGAYAKLGDYRDVVNDACIKVWSKYGDSLYDMSQLEIIKLIVKSIRWARLSKMRTKKDLSSQYFTNYISEFENFDITFRSNWLHDLELQIDASLNNLPQLPMLVDGFNSKDFIDAGIYKTKRIALYQSKLQVEKYKTILLKEAKY
jgi:hypothetical protein